MLRIFRKKKENSKPELDYLRFRCSRKNIDDWEAKFRKNNQKNEIYKKLLPMLKGKLAKRRFKAIFYMYEHHDVIKASMEDDDKTNADIGNLLDELSIKMKNDNVWWIRKYAIQTLYLYFEKNKKLLANLRVRLDEEKKKYVRIIIIRKIGNIVKNLKEKMLIADFGSELVKRLNKEKESEVKKSIIIALLKINSKLITLEHIEMLLETKNKKLIIGYGRFLANKLREEKHLISGLIQMLDNNDQDLIKLAVFAWILTNIKCKVNLDYCSIIEKVLDVAQEEKRRKETALLALALLRIDWRNIKGRKAWKKMVNIKACGDDLWNEYIKIEKDSDKIIEDIRRLLKSAKENAYFDVKSSIDISKHSIRKAEMVKDVIALLNSAKSNDDTAYLIVGAKEKNQEIVSFNNPKIIFKEFEQKISNLIDDYIFPTPDFELRQLLIFKLYLWQKEKEMPSSIKFTEEQKNPESKDEILIIQLLRESKEVYEVKKKIGNYRKGYSWYRSTTHTKDMTQTVRKKLMKK